MRKELKQALACQSAALALFIQPAFGEPTGGVIVEGTGVVNPQSGKTTTVDQISERLIIEWDSFDVAANEKVNFNQPSTDAIALNRILSGAPSVIEGQITANGRVFLINSDGIVFTSTAKVDVNGILATTMDIANNDFMAGLYNFGQAGDPSAGIVNSGAITAADAGLIAFVAPNVENAGLLKANLGSVVLASGEAFTLDFFGDSLIAFAAVDNDGNKTGSITNSGNINAAEGAILLTASAARDFINTVINIEADLVAESASMVGGKIILSGGENSTITISADLDAAGRDGGEIYIKGGEVYVEDSARLLADADQGMGDGGSISVSSFSRTEFAGLASATPGESAGQGGDISIASDGVLIFSGLADAGSGDRAGTVTLSAGGADQGGGTVGDMTGGSGGGGGSGSSGGSGGGSGSSGGGGGSGGGSTSGPIGGGPPVVVLPPAARDQAITAITEIASTNAVPPIDPELSSENTLQSAVVIFDDSIASDLILGDPDPGEDQANASLLCLHGVSEAACAD